MNILGLDPGSQNLGFGIISIVNKKVSFLEAGVIKIPKGSLQEQLLYMVDGLETILKKDIDQVALEDIFFAYNPKGVLKLAQFRGAILLKLLEKFDSVYEYTPLQIKKALTGRAKASKEQVAFMVKRLLNIKGEIKPLDISDALAVAITHAQRV
ncbi:MAG: crossover junction endodeoxyribonuclease RuvC [Epsilonproteobacteria bacterium]|nr:crossover junction endodeoxyribonuclease RuvC [Campylobacterota bacterium]